MLIGRHLLQGDCDGLAKDSPALLVLAGNILELVEPIGQKLVAIGHGGGRNVVLGPVAAVVESLVGAVQIVVLLLNFGLAAECLITDVAGKKTFGGCIFNRLGNFQPFAEAESFFYVSIGSRGMGSVHCDVS